MSSDYYFDDSEQVDSAFFAELDAIEAAQSQATRFPSPDRIPVHSNSSLVPHQSSSKLSPPSEPSPETSTTCDIPLKRAASPNTQPTAPDVDVDNSYDEFFDEIDPTDLARLDKDVEEAYKHGPSQSRKHLTLGPGATCQLDLFGHPLFQGPSRQQRTSNREGQPKPPNSPRKPFGRKAQKIKKWDHTAFAKSGWKSANKAKGKAKAIDVDGEAEEDAQMTEEFEQFPAPILEKYSFGAPPPFKHKADLLAAQTWLYPTNQPKRDYQFNIVRDSLFENSLVSLPTGLGKTFIAGVIMLNYYHWFPEGKVVFVAPTKPLVAQQIDACHKTCGIPGGDSRELTGQTSRAIRAEAWIQKRVFFMTPQTLMNDLKTENCDPTDIVLLVIDEAHKATGDYAYTQVVRYLMAKNGHFRVLALTATPGAKPEAVQAIVDSLHISHIEIRDENSIDLRQYILPKKISTHVIKMTADVIKVRDMLAKLMEKVAKRMIKSGLLSNLNVITLHSYRCNTLMQNFTQDGTGKKFPWVYPDLKKLGVLARAMGYLLECSIAMCHDEVHGLSTEVEKDGKKSANVRSEPLFRDIVKELERQHNAGFSLHPKLDKLQSLAVDYFAQAKADADEAARARLETMVEVNAPSVETKMMVFTNFRSSVDEIVDLLNTHQPMIRAARFVGQGSDKHGRRGIAQKDQLEVIKKFKEGVYNVLVATSIGEEGLDIGEVDMIICYDAQKTPIRMLQRVGRTGRKRAGRVEVLLSEAREEANWEKAKGDYESVQSSIIRGDSLQLFADVDRLLPDHIKPKCMEGPRHIEEHVRETKSSKSSSTIPKGTKRKRNTDVLRNIPEGAVNGFIPSSKLIPKCKTKKRKVTSREYDPYEIDDDDDDRAIQAGIHGPPLTKLKDKGKGKSKSKGKAKTAPTTRKKAATANCRGNHEITLSQLNRKVEDDTDDMEIECGPNLSSPQHPLAKSSRRRRQSLASPTASSLSLRSSPEHPLIVAETSKSHLSFSRTSHESHSEEDHSWLLDSCDEVKVIEDVSFVGSRQRTKLKHTSLPTPLAPSSFQWLPLSHFPPEKPRTNPGALSSPAPDPVSVTDASPELSFAVRVPGVRRKRKRLSSDSCSDKFQVLSPARSPSRSPIRSKQRRNHTTSLYKKVLLDLEAEVSGDETSSGDSDEDDVERESDHRFVEELAATQASPSYDQTSAYRHSLFTQAPVPGGPNFTKKPVRRGAFGPQSSRQRVPVQVSSPPTGGEAPDQYSMDSFVVEDDDGVILLEESCSSDI